MPSKEPGTAFEKETLLQMRVPLLMILYVNFIITFGLQPKSEFVSKSKIFQNNKDNRSHSFRSFRLASRLFETYEKIIMTCSSNDKIQ